MIPLLYLGDSILVNVVDGWAINFFLRLEKRVKLIKRYITADQLLRDSFDLALRVVESGFEPTFLIALWRGGTPIGIAIQEVLDLCGLEVNHIAVRTSSYVGIDQRDREVKVHGLSYAEESLQQHDRLLIVDDVHDSGRSVEALIQSIQTRCGDRTPEEIKLATVYYKPNRSEVARVPDFYLHEVDEWLVFPHELHGLDRQELLNKKPGLQQLHQRLIVQLEKSIELTTTSS